METFSSADFGLSGPVDWNVGQGGVSAVILETGGTTATGRATISVRYDTYSPTSGEADTAWVQAKKGDETKTKKRTVFLVIWGLKFVGYLAPDNNLRFLPDTGTETDKCEFNWKGENGAERIAAKMEAVCTFVPPGIAWSARGVTFRFSQYGGGAKFDCRLQRKRFCQSVRQSVVTYRGISLNDAGWVYDGNSSPSDAQYPTRARPNNAYRIDLPGIDPRLKQVAQRFDLREITEWHDGGGWRQISVSSQGEWYANTTAVLPDGRKGGSNDHGSGGAENIPNAQPAADAGVNQIVASGAIVTLDGSGSSDTDNDALTYQWSQPATSPIVTLSDSAAQKPTFTAPVGPTTLTFLLRVTDITAGLHRHNPGNGTSNAATVTVTVNAP